MEEIRRTAERIEVAWQDFTRPFMEIARELLPDIDEFVQGCYEADLNDPRGEEEEEVFI